MSLYSYRCESCGGSATWRPSKQQVRCRSCDTVVALPAADHMKATSFPLTPYLCDSPENRRQRTPARLERPCPTCNHVVLFESGIEGTTCEACLTPLLRPPHESDMPIRPTGVVPFRVDEAEARERLRTWWVGLRVHCPWRHTVTQDDGSKRVYDGEVRGDFGEREPGNHSLPADLLKALPFPFDHAVAYDRRYLAGAVVEQYDGDIFRAWDVARWRLDDMITSLVNKDAGVLGGPEERWPSWSQEKGWLILTPFYTTDVELDGERHVIVIDGHCGKIASTVPSFIPRVVWVVTAATLAAIVALAWWMF